MTTTTPEIQTRPDVGTRPVILPPYAVILHNDDVNEMGHVVRSLHRSVPSLTIARATDICSIPLASRTLPAFRPLDRGPQGLGSLATTFSM